MAGLDKQTPLVISRHLKDLYPNICQLMLVNNNSDLAYFHTIEDRLYESIERLFVWNGSTKIFLVMAKYIEDKMNLDPFGRYPGNPIGRKLDPVLFPLFAFTLYRGHDTNSGTHFLRTSGQRYEYCDENKGKAESNTSNQL